MRQQVDLLQEQLELAQEREQFQREQLQAKDEQIESLQRLLGAPKPLQPSSEQLEVPPEPQAKSNNSPADDYVLNSHSNNASDSSMATVKAMENVQSTETKRLSLFQRVIHAVFD
ncbi:hypothetical protein F980_00049 [Acinetobacter lwoffii NIPH 715]|nr:hypothetical protein F980_00049 [Acinetobacter lwoffii NIPH 715]